MTEADIIKKEIYSDKLNQLLYVFMKCSDLKTEDDADEFEKLHYRIAKEYQECKIRYSEQKIKEWNQLIAQCKEFIRRKYGIKSF